MSASLHRAILSSNNIRKISAESKSGEDVGTFLRMTDEHDTKEGGVLQNLRLRFGSAEEMAAFLGEHPRIRLLDCCFTDPLGAWHHCTFTTDHVDALSLSAGFGFDASSIAMFERIENSDFIMRPDPSTCWLDPFAKFPTLHVTGSIFTAEGLPYEKCPRQILSRAHTLLRDLDIADEVFIGPEAEFFLFNCARWSLAAHNTFFSVDGEEAYWNYDQSSNLAHRANLKGGYMTSRPVDKTADIRSEMLLTLEQLGIKSEKHHHEVATCQMEINIRAAGALECADNMQMLKYIVKNVAERHKKTATFMPKPLANDNGSGMHCNQSLWKGNANLFYDEKGSFHQMSQMGLWYMAGILKHCRSLLAIACPTTNSYRRLVPDFEAPVHITYSAGNRSTAIRVPTFCSQKTKRIEFRMPDASCCPYLAFAAMILAGIDGIVNQLELPRMGEGNLFDPSNPIPEELERAPHSLDEALDALQKDHEYLLRGNVFTKAFLNSFITSKRAEVRALRCCPHPREFMLYYGC